MRGKPLRSSTSPLAQSLGFPQLPKSFTNIHRINLPMTYRIAISSPLPRSEGKVKLYDKNAPSETKNISPKTTRTTFSQWRPKKAATGGRSRGCGCAMAMFIVGLLKALDRSLWLY